MQVGVVRDREGRKAGEAGRSQVLKDCKLCEEVSESHKGFPARM